MVPSFVIRMDKAVTLNFLNQKENQERDVIGRRLFEKDSRTVNNFYEIGKSF
ncbi:MAG: hypothetical protein ACI33P_04940 [Lysinibacillus sp.]